MSRCPVCGKNFEAHAVAGRQEGLRVGDPVISHMSENTVNLLV